MMKLLYSIYFFIFLMFGRAHEPVEPDGEIHEISGIILDGEIVSKKIVQKVKVTDVPKIVYRCKVDYQYEIEDTLRDVFEGKFSKGKVLLISEYCFSDDNTTIGSYNVGDVFRYVYNFGKFVDDKFVPADEYTNKKILEDTYVFPIDVNYTRPHLYGKPIDWDGKVINDHHHFEKTLLDSEEVKN